MTLPRTNVLKINEHSICQWMIRVEKDMFLVRFVEYYLFNLLLTIPGKNHVARKQLGKNNEKTGVMLWQAYLLGVKHTMYSLLCCTSFYRSLLQTSFGNLSGSYIYQDLHVMPVGWPFYIVYHLGLQMPMRILATPPAFIHLGGRLTSQGSVWGCNIFHANNKYLPSLQH